MTKDICFREALKKKPKKVWNFPNFPDPPPLKFGNFPKFWFFFQVAQKHIETNEYVLIHPEMEEKKFADQILTVYCTILYSTVPYSTGYNSLSKVKFSVAIAT